MLLIRNLTNHEDMNRDQVRNREGLEDSKGMLVNFVGFEVFVVGK
jgi:hypothetical protein